MLQLNDKLLQVHDLLLHLFIECKRLRLRLGLGLVIIRNMIIHDGSMK